MKVAFVIMNSGEDPAVTTDAIGVTPTKIRIKVEAYPKGTVVGNSMWTLDSSIDSLDLENHLTDILLRLSKYANLKTVPKSWIAGIHCRIEIDEG